MNNKIKLYSLCFLIALFLLYSLTIWADQETDEAKFTVTLDPSLLDGSREEIITSAWLAYGLARIGWIKENVPVEDLKNDTYHLTFEEEFYGREKLAQIWEEFKEKNPQLKDRYLDTLLKIFKANFLKEYVWIFFKDESWKKPSEELQLSEFVKWSEKNQPEIYQETLAGVIINRK